MAIYNNKAEFTALALALTAVWDESLVLDSEVARFFNQQSSSRAAERTQGHGNLGLVPDHDRGGINYAEIDPGDRKEFRHRRKTQGIRIPQDFVEDDEYNIVAMETRKLAESFARTVTYDMSSVFNEAFSTTNYTVADGKALCATGRNSGKAVLNNKGTSALTHDNVVATRKLMRQFKDPNGLVINSRGDTLLVPVGLMEKAEEIVTSVQRSDNAENAANVNRPLSYVVDPLLEDDNNWFLIDSGKAPMHLWWWWRVRPDFATDPKSMYDLELRLRGTMRYSFGADNFVWIYGHEVT